MLLLLGTRKSTIYIFYPLVNVYVTMENHNFQWVNPLLITGLEHEFYFPFHIWDVILPIDELHHFSRWLLHHQAVFLCFIAQGTSKYFATLSMGIPGS